MGGWPKDPDAKKAIKALEDDFAWVYVTVVGKSSHATGKLMCQKGCTVWVYATSKNPARALWGSAKRCPHGGAPDRRSP